jgi:hypothetical protein
MVSEARVARTTGTASLLDLINAGHLHVGEELVIRRRSATPVIGSVESDGSIRIGDDTFATPSLAAKEVLGLKATNGWKRWRVTRLGDHTLADVRDAR